MIIRIKGLKRYVDKTGRVRLYHRNTGTALDPKLSGAELAIIVARLDRAKPHHAANTFGGLLDSYQSSLRFTRLAARTQRDYNKIIAYLAPLRDKPLSTFDVPFIAKLRDKTFAIKRAGFTNHMLAMLAGVFKHGIEYGHIKANPVAGIEKAIMPRDRKRKARPWAPEELAAVIPAAPIHLRVPLVMAAAYGFRRSDIIALPRAVFDGAYITMDTGKTGRYMRLPATPAIAEFISANAGKNFICENSRGMAWTDAGLSASMGKFFKRCIAASIAKPGITMHGLRHTVSTRLREAGFDSNTARLYVGHEDPAMTEHYSSSADLSPALQDMARAVQSGLPV